MGYYKVSALGNGVYSFFEMTGVGCYLICGAQRALLLDTGYGFGNLRREVEKVTSLPLVVVNTHAHADHCRGNSQFEKVYVSEADLPRLSGDYLQKQYDLLVGYGTKLAPALRLVLLYARLKRKPRFATQIETLPAGMAFELGGRRVTLLPMAGHTPGSVMALDAATQTVFAGDAVNPGLFLFFEREVKLHAYADKLDAFAALPGYRLLRISHQPQPLPFAFAGWYAGLLRRAALEKSVATDFPNEGRTVYQYTENSDVYGECSVFFDVDNL